MFLHPPQAFCMWVHIERLINHFPRWGPLGESSYRFPLPARLMWLVLRDMVLLFCCCDILVVSFCSDAGHVNSDWSRRGTYLFIIINLRFLVRIYPAAVLMTYLRCGLTPITTPYMSQILMQESYRAVCKPTWIFSKGSAVLL